MTRFRPFFFTLIILSCSICQANQILNLSPVNSSENINESLESKINFDQVESGDLYFKGPDGVQHSLVLSSDYKVKVTGLMARVTLTQRFYNPDDVWAEAIYVFPLAQGVAIDAMQIKIADRVIKADIKRRKQATKIYNKAKKTGKKAALLEQQRPNIFTTSVANIPSKEYIEVQISYLQPLPIQDNVFSLRLPLTITPRYIPQGNSPTVDNKSFGDADNLFIQQADDYKSVTNISGNSAWGISNEVVPDANKITPWQIPTHLAQQATIAVHLNLGVPITAVQSLYHPIKHHGDSVTLDSTSIAMNRDFVLQWRFAEQSIPKAAFFKESKGEFDHGLMLITPPAFKLDNHSPSKEIIYVIDTSGSMGGVAIRQAKRALSYGISQLSVDDTFNIIEFNSQHSNLFGHSLPASRMNITLAKNWIDQLSAGGGTNMLPALKVALNNIAFTGNNEVAVNRQVIFITDGSIGNEVQLLQAITQDIAESRLHTIGIGSAPNSYFMEQAAQLGRGSFSYIGDLHEVELQMSRLFTRISQPLLTNIQVDFLDKTAEVLPLNIPDLYAGQPLVISARWPKQPIPDIKISGLMLGKAWSTTLNISNVEQHSGVATWWAREKINQLNFLLLRPELIATGVYAQNANTAEINELAKASDYRDRLIESITNLALEHQLMTRYTSFVAVEQVVSREAEQGLATKPVANAMPLGSTQTIPFAQTSTMSDFWLVLGAMLLSLSLLLTWVSAKDLIFWKKRAADLPEINK